MAYDQTSISEMSQQDGFRHDGKDYFFKEGVSWSGISSGVTAFRYLPRNYTFNNAAPCAFFDNKNDLEFILLGANSAVARIIIRTLNPTMNFNPGDFGNIPFPYEAALPERDGPLVRQLVSLAKNDWDAFETSWDFSASPLIVTDQKHSTVSKTFRSLFNQWRETTFGAQRAEVANNKIFINAYKLEDKVSPDVALSEIPLTCNPHYRYGGDKTEQELEDLLRADTMREFISYAVGCMFGRYSLDKPGLILANQGETLEDYLRQVPEPRFMPDADNVIPLLDGDWFPDDVTGRFREFLRVTFGDEHYDENLRFIEAALGKKGKPLPIRDFFLKDFYADHVKRYKKRPIYWLFSSPKGSFNALIYLHRYRPDTVSIVLQYLRDFRSKLVSERDHQTQVSISTSASQGEKTKALKRIEELKKVLVELDDYERDTLYPLATRQVPLDLDDGVKVNYAKLGAALKKIPGLDAADE